MKYLRFFYYKVAQITFLLLMCFSSIAQTGLKQRASQEWLISNNIAFGSPTKGGGGGKVIKVTNLNLGGAGSLRAALRTPGPRIVVFEVAGVIDLKRTTIKVVDPYLTIAGQTAPSPGITLIRGGISIRTHDVFIQHLRVRPGAAEQIEKSGFDPDGLSTFGGNAYNIIIDHCSLTWGIDENLSASGYRNGVDSTSHKITFSNNIIGEGLYSASHGKGIHSMGTLVHDFVQDIAIVGNLYTCNNRRNPFFKAFTKGAVINNVIYNPGMAAIHMNWSKEELAHLPYQPKNGKISIVGNVMYAGPDTKKGLALVSGKGDAYLEDNLTYGIGKEKLPMISDQINILNQRPSWPDDFIPLPAWAVKSYVSKNVGARPKDRDMIDSRIIGDLLRSKGHKINNQSEVGGYPKYTPTYRKLVVPNTGIDQWLYRFSENVEYIKLSK